MIDHFKRVGAKRIIDWDRLLLIPIMLKVYNLDDDKEYIEKIFWYMYHHADAKGHIKKSGLSPKEAHEWATVTEGLSKTFKPDSTIKQAIVFMTDMMNTLPVENLVHTAIKGLNLSQKVIGMMGDYMQMIIDKGLDPDKYEDLDIKINTLIAKSAGVPKQVNTLISLLQDWDAAESGSKLMKGKRTYKTSYDGLNEDSLGNDSEVEVLEG